MRRRSILLVAGLCVAAIAPTPAEAQTGRERGVAPSSLINSPFVADAMTTNQHHLTGSDGQTWKDMDPANLSITMHSPGNISVILMGNADLRTANAGYNQDIGIAVSGGTAPTLHYPTMAGQPEAWKESGGFAGTFSPNAAFVEIVIDLSANQDYTFKLQWKTSKGDPGTIYAGAGRCPTGHTPTRA
jgi:hypothetical protein